MSPIRVRELKNRQRVHERRYGGSARRLEVGPITFAISAIVTLTAMTMMYLSQSNHQATLGYEIQDLKKAQTELKRENERLTVEITRAQSAQEVNRVAEEKGAFGMVSAKTAVYAPLAPRNVAAAR